MTERADEPWEAKGAPLGAPTDPLRPTGRVAEPVVAGSVWRRAGKARRMFRLLAVGMLAAILLALLLLVVSGLLPKPDL